MEIGISMFGDLAFDEATGKFRSAQARLNEMLEEVKLADEAGLDVFGVGEHHRPDYAVSAPEIILAAAAGVTKNIKLTSSVTVLSSADPVRVYQNFATLDLLSNGRAEITAGRGSFTESFPLFGFDLEDYSTLFVEKLDLLLKINKNAEAFSWKGKFRPSLQQQQVLPRATDNHIDIWIAVGGTPESVARAARLGLPLVIAIIGGAPKQFKPYFDFYRDEYIRNGHSAPRQQGTHSHGIVARDGKALADRIFPGYAAQMSRVGRDRGWPPYSREQFEAGRTRDGALFIGEPNEVIDKILYHQEMFGLTRFIMHTDIGAPSHADLMKSIELLGAEIAPAVRKAVKGGSI